MATPRRRSRSDQENHRAPGPLDEPPPGRAIARRAGHALGMPHRLEHIFADTLVGTHQPCVGLSGGGDVPQSATVREESWASNATSGCDRGDPERQDPETFDRPRQAGQAENSRRLRGSRTSLDQLFGNAS